MGFQDDLAAALQRGKLGPIIDPDMFIELRKLAADRDEARDRLFCAVGSWRLEKCCLELHMARLWRIMGDLIRAGSRA